MSTRATAAVKAVDVGLLIVVTAFFWWPAVRHSMWDYAIQQNPVMATHSAVVTDVWRGRAGHANVTFTTNAGQRVDADLGPGMFTCCSVFKGEELKVKYVSYDPSQVYESDYHPSYGAGMFYGGAFLIVALIWSLGLRKEWRTRNSNWAASAARVGD